MTTQETRSIQVWLFSYGHANGPIIQQPGGARFQRTLAYNIRHLPNPPRHLRAKSTGLSRRLQKEFLQNDDVEAFLVKAQDELLNEIREGCEQLSRSSNQNDNGRETVEDLEINERSGLNGTRSASNEPGTEDPDIDIVVTVCCEEGQHRSVAFIEELARRLSDFKHGDGSQTWQLSVDIIHRDITDPQELGQPLGSNNPPNKARAKSRQKQRRDKGNRYNASVGDDEG